MLISKTCNVLKLDKSNNVKDEHSPNIFFIVVTPDVSKFDTFINFKEEQL